MVDDNYEINELFDLEVVLEDGQKAEKLVLVDESGESTLSVNIIKSLKDIVETTNELTKNESSEVLGFIQEHSDFIGDNLAILVDNSELLSCAHDVVYQTFTGLPSLDIILAFLVTTVISIIEVIRK
ncbi:hypothetical protein [Vibrio splendidus]|uniref:hypothetical protein n=1 Tax=Vibrio splendidus TaxID=29497 RepID=UPI000D35CBDF|nr:hypothetical protein [Vibrio splendidus]PTO93342.1 hypothetical protein CWO29_03750 [Vibrio splendidus]